MNVYDCVITTMSHTGKIIVRDQADEAARDTAYAVWRHAQGLIRWERRNAVDVVEDMSLVAISVGQLLEGAEYVYRIFLIKGGAEDLPRPSDWREGRGGQYAA